MKLIFISLVIFIFGISFLHAQEEINTSSQDTLIVGYNINAPFIYKDNDKLEGLSYRLWQKITANDNNFYKLEYYPLDSLLLGLSNGSIDIGLSPLTITSDRSEKIDFSVPYYISNSTVIVKKLNFKQKVSRFYSSISIINFLKILGFLFILLAVFGLFVWIFEGGKNEEFGKGIHGFWNGIWWSAVTMTTVGYGDKSPKTFGGRVVGLIWMFAAIILISSITAGITSSLTVKKLSWSNDDLSTFKEVTIGTVKGSATERRLLDNYYNNLKSYHTFDELLYGLKKDEVQVVAYDEPLLRFVLKNEKDFKDFEFLNISFNQSLYAMGFSKKLSAKKKAEMSQKILEFSESNDWKILLSKYDLINNQRLILETK
ncbi:MAG: transporter substrate-binding domain-containing protein [Bacteroidota bacterium]